MKIILNREEIKQLRELTKTIGEISGDRIDSFLDNFNITRKAYLVSMISGELTIEVKEEFTTELVSLINGATSESAPTLKAIIELFKTLIPTQMKYAQKLKDLFNRYDDSVEPAQQYKSAKSPWSVVSVETEKVELLDLNKEAV